MFANDVFPLWTEILHKELLNADLSPAAQFGNILESQSHRDAGHALICKKCFNMHQHMVHKEIVHLRPDEVQSSLHNSFVDLLTSFHLGCQILQHGYQTHQPIINYLSSAVCVYP